MKRITIIILVIALLICLGGCANREKQAVLLDYINNNIAELGSIEDELLSSYASVTGENYVSDAEAYVELTTNTLALARELNDRAVEMAAEITDPELIEVHRLYMSYSNKFLSAVTIMISAIERQDATLIAEANEKLNEANNLGVEFALALKELTEKYKVE